MNTMKQMIPLIMLFVLLIGCTSTQVTVPKNLLSTGSPVSAVSTRELTKTAKVLEKPKDLKSAEEKAGFEMILPTDLPVNYQYSNAQYLPEISGVFVQYSWRDPKFSGEMLFFTQQRKAPAIQKEAATEIMQMSSSQAIFYQGGLFDTGWVAEAPVFTLSFSQGDFYYTIVFNGNEPSSAGWITKEEMLRLAEQLQ